tara:strand:- start:163 stop:393 length:231 start_codon:yes stop_codon:yes gene_type:complete
MGCYLSIGRAPVAMAFISPAMLGMISTLARALVSGCGLLAAHSFHSGDDASGFGAPVAIKLGAYLIGELFGIVFSC